MKMIYLVRHCRAEGQVAEARLTAAGVEQANKLAAFFTDKAIELVVSSPYERAYRSIKPLADKIALPITLDERLTERVLSDRNHPDWQEMLRKTFDDPNLSYEGGESSNIAMNRGIGVVMEALDSGHNNIVIVSHGNLISLMLKYFDDRIGFDEWQSLSNPDVYALAFSTADRPDIQRIWTDE